MYVNETNPIHVYRDEQGPEDNWTNIKAQRKCKSKIIFLKKKKKNKQKQKQKQKQTKINKKTLVLKGDKNWRVNQVHQYYW